MWLTPPELFQVLNSEFWFDMDAAATEDNTFCRHFISPEQDALVTLWDRNRVWCNPPYSLIGPFVQRAYEQHLAHKNTIVMLIPTYTDPKYWRDYVTKAHEVRHLVGRVQFVDGNLGKKRMSARFPSSIVIFKYIPGVHYGKGPNIWSWDWRAQ